MKLCYGLLLSGKENQAIHLIKLLNVNDNEIMIHVDAKNDELYNSLYQLFSHEEHIHFTKRRIACSWGHVSLIEAMVELLNNVEPLTFDYYTLLSESCLPTKTDQEIKTYLEKHYPTEFIECFIKRSCRSRLHLYHYEITEKQRIHRNQIAFKEILLDFFFGWKIGNKDFKSWKVYHGTQWSTITHDFVSYAVKYIKEHDLLKKYQYVMFGDEHFMQEIFVHSPYFKNKNSKYKKRGAALTYINWKVLDAPKVLTMDDLKYLEQEDVLYARKFDEKSDKKIMEYLYHKREKVD